MHLSIEVFLGAFSLISWWYYPKVNSLDRKLALSCQIWALPSGLCQEALAAMIARWLLSFLCSFNTGRHALLNFPLDPQYLDGVDLLLKVRFKTHPFNDMDVMHMYQEVHGGTSTLSSLLVSGNITLKEAGLVLISSTSWWDPVQEHNEQGNFSYPGHAGTQGTWALQKHTSHWIFCMILPNWVPLNSFIGIY